MRVLGTKPRIITNENVLITKQVSILSWARSGKRVESWFESPASRGDRHDAIFPERSKCVGDWRIQGSAARQQCPRILLTNIFRGLGALICEKFAAEGSNIVVNYVSSKDRADQVAEKCKEFGVKAVVIQAVSLRL